MKNWPARSSASTSCLFLSRSAFIFADAVAVRFAERRTSADFFTTSSSSGLSFSACSMYSTACAGSPFSSREETRPKSAFLSSGSIEIAFLYSSIAFS